MRIPSLVVSLLLPVAACDAPEPATPTAVPGGQHIKLVPDPGPRPPETPPTATLWRRGAHGWHADGRIMAVAPGGRAVVDADRQLIVDGAPRLSHALPDLRVDAQGAVFVSRSALPPASNIWRVDPDGTRTQLTHDDRSDRPFPLPDGRLLWVSGAGGMAGFVLDGARLSNRPGDPFVPVPARHAASRIEGDRFIYDAGDGLWSLDLRTGKAAAQ